MKFSLDVIHERFWFWFTCHCVGKLVLHTTSRRRFTKRTPELHPMIRAQLQELLQRDGVLLFVANRNTMNLNLPFLFVYCFVVLYFSASGSDFLDGRPKR